MDIKKGCVVFMKGSSGLIGFGNAQCVSNVCEPLGTIGLYGHNEHYKISDISKIVEEIPQSKSKEEEQEFNEISKRLDVGRDFLMMCNETVNTYDVLDAFGFDNAGYDKINPSAGIDQREEPGNCLKEYNEDICDGCKFREYEMVSHPGGESTASVEKAKCGWGHWEDDF